MPQLEELYEAERRARLAYLEANAALHKALDEREMDDEDDTWIEDNWECPNSRTGAGRCSRG